jgi:4-hydroxy-tetrahydrodipicolinate reductase
MIRVVVCGALGRMGRLCVERINSAADLELAAQVDVAGNGEAVLTSLEHFSGTADLVIDFSFHTATPAVMAWAAAHNVGVIMCTTGQNEEEKAAITAAAEQIPVFWSSNMSLGIALLIELAKKTAAAFPEADIEIVETHHNRKVDAPSGTALSIGKAIQEIRSKATFLMGRSGMAKRTLQEIGFHAIRRGNIPGIHEVIVSTDTQAITLKHEVYDRALFADGALSAARFLAGKQPGLYQMQNLID